MKPIPVPGYCLIRPSCQTTWLFFSCFSHNSSSHFGCHNSTSSDICHVNTLRPWQYERHFADDIFKSIFLNKNVWIPIEISQKFVLKSRINNIETLVQIMAWCRPGDKPLSETMICVTRPQWIKHIEIITSTDLLRKILCILNVIFGVPCVHDNVLSLVWYVFWIPKLLTF